ncbi:hypothetical protein L195_g046154, partial [Trifolium pratense]
MPKQKYREFLADIDAAAKLRAEGKQPDKFMFDKYFEGPGNMYKPKPLANWKEMLHEMKEKEAAKARANLMKKAYINEKEMCLIDAKAESLKRKGKKAYQKEKEICLIDAKAESLKRKGKKASQKEKENC